MRISKYEYTNKIYVVFGVLHRPPPCVWLSILAPLGQSANRRIGE